MSKSAIDDCLNNLFIPFMFTFHGSTHLCGTHDQCTLSTSSVGTLLSYIQQRQELLEDEAVLLNLATQICAAMEFLEANGIFHKDLVIKL